MYYYIAHGLILMMSISKRLRRNQRIVHKGIETCQRNILKKDINFLDFLELIIKSDYLSRNYNCKNLQSLFSNNSLNLLITYSISPTLQNVKVI